MFRILPRTLRSAVPKGGPYEMLTAETRGRVSLLTLNRPKALNALCDKLLYEILDALHANDANGQVGATVLTGSERAFAAGADIKEMKDKSFAECYETRMFDWWDEIQSVRKPIIAAVNGFALGGGCELAMACDMIFAGDKAKFGQPEIKLGTIPGCGGTQRLTAAVGKYRAMDLVLTGDMLGADEALRCGLVSRVVPAANLVETALAAGETIAGYSQPIVAIAKEAVKKSQDLPLTEGITYERRMFWSTFATEDQKEGMDAFATKREAKFTNK
eukprot:TRINITY_DN576_c0_g1_i1.p2 TRINITY_DN576_c0_g1~~TRINITY_DN576_c0_g1_i1.p2  ORF type:complete len:290 (-),score=151.24 TRINITY_DN576_c0_g1_i1:55-876(-)